MSADLDALLGRGVIVCDGAMGTMLHAAGAALDRSLPELNLSDPRLVATLHESYLSAGADIIQTNTFGANRLWLGGHGFPDMVDEINRAGIRIARAAQGKCDREVLVAASVSPAVTARQRRQVGSAERLEVLREQILSLSGADLIILETFGYLDELVEAVSVASETCDLPIIAQATFADDAHTLGGETPREVATVLSGLPVTMLGTNCTIGPQRMLAVAEDLARYASVPVTAQPNAGQPRRTGPRSFEFSIDGGYVARYFRLFAAAGVSLVGGCCGTTPAHIRAAAGAVRPSIHSSAGSSSVSAFSAGAGNDRTGNDGTGNAGTGNAGVGDDGTGNAGTGNAGVGDAWAGDDGAGDAAIRRAPAPVPPPRRARRFPRPAAGSGFAIPPEGSLAERLAAGRFVTAAAIPSSGGRASQAVQAAAVLHSQGIEVFEVQPPDCARTHSDSLHLALHVQQQAGVETIATVATWDKTIMTLQAELLGAHALGLRCVICTTGSPPVLGDYPAVDGIWEVDSLGLVGLLSGLNDGRDSNGLALTTRTSFCVGARVNPGAQDQAAEIARAKEKVRAGAQFLVSRPVYELDSLLRLVAALEPEKVPLLLSVTPLRSFEEADYLAHEVPGVTIPPDALRAMERAGRTAARAAGIDLAASLLRDARKLINGVILTATEEDPTALCPLLAAVS